MASGTARQTAGDGPATALTRVVERARRRIVAATIVAGTLLVAAVAVATVVGAVIVDLVVPLRVPWRIAAAVGWWLAVALAVFAFLVVPARRWPTLEAVALRIERVLGGMHNRLLTVLDLESDGGRRARTRPDLLVRLLEQTQERLRGFRVGRVVSRRAPIRAAAIAGAGVAAVAALSAVFGDRLTTTLERLRHPTADIPPATYVQFSVPGDIEVLVDEPLSIDVAVTRGECTAAEIVLEDGGSRRLRYPLRPVAGGFVGRLEGLDRDARYRVEGGGTWSRTHAIRLLTRPTIEQFARVVRLPSYMRIDEPLPVIGDPPRIEAPEGATVEFIAAVRPDPVGGSLTILERSIETEQFDTFDERVWFEDDLPRDAVFAQPWRWTTAYAAGGVRGFVCDDDRTASLRTRLEPLVLPKDELTGKGLMVMVRCDPAAPPRRIVVEFDAGAAKAEVAWVEGGGNAADDPPVAGPLPAPGAWARLTVPLESLPALAGKQVSAATFRVEGGRAVLDRPGWFALGTRTVERVVDRARGRIEAEPVAEAAGDAAGRWRAVLPVERRSLVTLAFTDGRDHPSLPLPPVEIVPTVDRPPALVIASPADMLPLELPDDVIVEGEAFDDWGIDSLAVRVGPDAEHLSPPRPLADVALADRPPDTRFAFAATVPLTTLGLEPGRGGAWKLVVRDTKGQMVESSLHRVTVVPAPDAQLARSQVPAIEQARRLAEQMAAAGTRDAAGLDAQRERLLEAVGRDTVEALEAVAEATRRGAEDGADPQAAAAARGRLAAAQRLADEAATRLAAPQREALERLDRFLDARAAESDRIAEALARAAEQARASNLVPERFKERLDTLAADARRSRRALEKSPDMSGDAAALERIANTPEPNAIAVSAERLAAAAGAEGREIDAVGAARRLDGLAGDLARRAAALRTRAGRDDAPAPADRSADASPSPLPPVPTTGDQAAPPDRPPSDLAALPNAIRQLREVEQILGRPIAAAPSSADGAGATPVPADDSLGARLEAAGAAATAAGRSAERFAGQLSGRVPIGADSADAAAGRASPIAELLDSPPVQEALQMADRARRLQLRAANKRGADSGQRSGEGAASDEAGDGQSGRGRAQGAGEEAGDPSSEGGGRDGERRLDPALRGLDARRRAAIERLPPRVRDPLLEGMRERGPEAYREVIETYFRRLGKDVAP